MGCASSVPAPPTKEPKKDLVAQAVALRVCTGLKMKNVECSTVSQNESQHLDRWRFVVKAFGAELRLAIRESDTLLGVELLLTDNGYGESKLVDLGRDVKYNAHSATSKPRDTWLTLDVFLDSDMQMPRCVIIAERLVTSICALCQRLGVGSTGV